MKDKADSKSSASKKDETSTTGQASKDTTEKSTTGQGSSDSKASSTARPLTPRRLTASPSTAENRQSQDPNAAKQNQTSGSSTQSNSTTEQSNASIRSQAGVQVSSEQRTTIQRSVL